jgi:hypothetical protein
VRVKRSEAASAESRGTSRKLVVGVMFPPMAAPFVWMLYELNTPLAALIGVALIQSVVLGGELLALRAGTKADLLQSTTQRLASLSRR